MGGKIETERKPDDLNPREYPYLTVSDTELSTELLWTDFGEQQTPYCSYAIRDLSL